MSFQQKTICKKTDSVISATLVCSLSQNNKDNKSRFHSTFTFVHKLQPNSKTLHFQGVEPPDVSASTRGETFPSILHLPPHRCRRHRWSWGCSTRKSNESHAHIHYVMIPSNHTNPHCHDARVTLSCIHNVVAIQSDYILWHCGVGMIEISKKNCCELHISYYIL